MRVVTLMHIIILQLLSVILVNSEEQPALDEVQPKFATPCTTPNKDVGLCIEVRNCSVLINAIISGKNDSYDFIRESRCGPANEDVTQPKVCCGKYDNYVDKRFSVPCTTPNKDMGVCVEVQSCSVFTDVRLTEKNDNNDFIRESRCGPSNEDVTQTKVCCGKFDNYLNKTIILNKTQPSESPNNNPFPDCTIRYDNTATLIVGGLPTKLEQFPWMARLEHRRSDDLFTYGCVGFLISHRFVLTAAHCIRSEQLEKLGPIHQVQLGEYDTESDQDCIKEGNDILVCADPPQLLRTAEPIVHPEYIGDSQQHNDIAIIPLIESAIFTKYVNPICLPETLSEEVTTMWLSGWGKTETKNASPIKLFVTVSRVDNVECTKLYKPVGIIILDSQLCAGGESGRDSCSGDSGGPLMVQKNDIWYAEGVVSFGRGCGLANWPGIYTSIPYYMPWIKMVMNRYLEEHKQEIETEDRKLESLRIPLLATTE